MCGRYASSRNPDDLVEEFEVRAPVAQELPPDFNVAPTKEVYAVMDRSLSGETDPVRQLRVVRWGLVPFWAKDPGIGNKMINARLETLADKPAFRQAVAKRRCLVPADGYYEWYTPTQGGPTGKNGKPLKQPFYIYPADGSVMAMAGLYEIWKDPTRADDDPERFRWTCTIVTHTAEDALGHIHERMPVLVAPERYASWLDPTVTAPDDVAALLVDAGPGRLTAHAVSTEVNSVGNNGPALRTPIDVS